MEVGGCGGRVLAFARSTLRPVPRAIGTGSMLPPALNSLARAPGPPAPAPVAGVAYSLDGQVLPPGMMPSTLEDLGRVEVQYETMPGWQTSIADCRSWDDLPANAQAYIRRVEELVGCPVSWVGVGPGREAMLQLCD